MNRAESIYARLPIPLQQAACSWEGWRIRRHRYGDRFPELLRAAEARAEWSEDRLFEYRDRRRQAFIAQAQSSVAYYRDGRWSEREVLEKDAVRAEPLRFRSDRLREAERRPVHTSGTTGAGLRFWTTVEAMQEQWAVWWRYRRWHGLELGTLCGYFGGRSVVPAGQSRPPYWRYDLAGRQIFFSGYHLRDACLPDYVNELRRSRPPWLHGYPSLLALLASYVLDRGLDLGYRIRWVTTGAENLLPHQREVMQRAFGVRPRQHYGMAEAVANASECEAGGLHIDEDFAHVELLPTGGGSCRVAGTNFTNAATPLIRYAVADHATWAESRCRCGRPGRVLASLDGRQEDYVQLADGTRVGRLDHVFKDLTEIREAQVVQEEPGQILIRVVRGRGYGGDTEARLRKESGARLNGARIEIEYVEELERTATGKLRLVINRRPEGQILRPGAG